MSVINIGSMRVLPKDPRHCTGDGNDGTTTIMHKAIAMSHGINLLQHRAAELSVRRHRIAKAIVLWTAVVLISALAARFILQHNGA